MASSISLWRNSAPKTYDGRDATQAMATQLGRFRGMLESLPRQERRLVAQDLAVTITSVIGSSIQLDFSNMRQVIEMEQQIKMELARTAGQHQVLVSQHRSYARVITECFRTVVTTARQLEILLLQARSTLQTPEGREIVESAFDRARTHLLTLADVINRYELDSPFSSSMQDPLIGE